MLPHINELYELIASSLGFMKKPRVLVQSFKDRALAAARAFDYLKIKEVSDRGGRSKGRDSKRSDQNPRLASQATVIPAEEGMLVANPSLDQLFGLFVASRSLVLDERMENAAVKDLNRATMGLVRLALSTACTYPTQIPSVKSVQVPRDPLEFIAVRGSSP